MTVLNVQPSKFITIGTEIQALFVDEDGESLKWYKGIVTRVVGQNDGFVRCDVVYDDGEVVKDTELYDVDFDSGDYEDAWKFDNEISHLVKYMVSITSGPIIPNSLDVEDYEEKDDEDSYVPEEVESTQSSKDDDINKEIRRMRSYLIVCDSLYVISAALLVYSMYSKLLCA